MRTTSCCDVDLQGEVHLLHADVCFREHIWFHPVDVIANSCEIIMAHLFTNTFERRTLHFYSYLKIHSYKQMINVISSDDLLAPKLTKASYVRSKH